MNRTTSSPTIGILGAGKLGLALARLAQRAGYSVVVASRSEQYDLAMMLDVLAPGVIAGTPQGLGETADIVILAIPLHQYRSLSSLGLSRSLVIDAMNYWPTKDGAIEIFESSRSSSEVVGETIGSARLVKALNQVGYADLESSARPRAEADRVAIGVATDDVEARAQVAELVDALGFDPVLLPSLAAGRALEPDSSTFGTPYRRREFEELVKAAV